MGAKASTSADPPVAAEPATPSRESHSSHGSGSHQQPHHVQQQTSSHQHSGASDGSGGHGGAPRSPQSPQPRDGSSVGGPAGLAAILADLGRRASLDSSTSSSAGRRARSLSGLVVGSGSGTNGSSTGGGSTTHPLETPTSAHETTPLADSAQSLPLHFMSFNGIRCPVCSRVVLPHDCELHLVLCLTKPSLAYNEELLTEARPDSECVICLEEFAAGQTIARLPCLCIYHKSCIDAWFRVNRSCPEHPSD
ncbi:E3 ubiquitin-protein ligase ZNRF1-like [Varroa jacobsoni]|uniref:E3 ubiquitin-protein ligase ZNRF1 n=1 Tax=Varroa destructor TaxID=109461 RepID=A0A7M7JBZ4_VARDE|nr:E3 ubiquitin-protein ligase ZNRF1-like [Varroa destructor]XP_022645830.1 E3 ubiquitin-protein ligase ZNRF1-like [Varroa destructor]XP_022645842.1 E3 ubiquitin-protein ligase ZNRF1-like [Varroa destructor]XP_022645849.1 E3 ubiquitin-protein ligase ZNRF1-like [Varroa destructor]XP_022701068.1 E3 ubiquitin-protein ligase ZNRF1-like [Varroa jacobsoni]XP_022701069.1 E3 ubiquitin-protein ligase ZNRF1-like [Varroa jacobsoni]